MDLDLPMNHLFSACHHRSGDFQGTGRRGKALNSPAPQQGLEERLEALQRENEELRENLRVCQDANTKLEVNFYPRALLV